MRLAQFPLTNCLPLSISRDLYQEKKQNKKQKNQVKTPIKDFKFTRKMNHTHAFAAPDLLRPGLLLHRLQHQERRQQLPDPLHSRQRRLAHFRRQLRFLAQAEMIRSMMFATI